jgi:hypothetical protein
VLIILAGMSAGDPIQTQEFATQQACWAAARWVTTERPINLEAKCFPLASTPEPKP